MCSQRSIHACWRDLARGACASERDGLEEPPEWTVHCDCCNNGRGKTFTKNEIKAERRKVEAMGDVALAAWEEEHARSHHGQCWGCEPVLPYHESCVDALHLVLNIFKVGMAERPIQNVRFLKVCQSELLSIRLSVGAPQS